MKKPELLDELEMHDLLRLLYPEHIKSDDDEYYELSQEACMSVVDIGGGFEVDLPDLLARMVMLAAPMGGGLSGKMYHCLGRVTVRDGAVHMEAAVRREVGNEYL